MSKSAKRIPSLRAGAKRVFRKRQRATTARRVTRTVAAPATSPVAQTTTAVPQTIYLQMVTLAMVIMCVGAIALSRRPSPLEAAPLPQTPDAAAVPQAAALAFAATTAPAGVAPGAASRPVSAPAAKAAVPNPEKIRIAEAPSPTAAVAAIDEALGKEDSPNTLVRPESIVAEPSSVSVDPVAPEGVTVTGCLESSGSNQFRLTDTQGIDTPRSRSWRSGFLKKRSTSVNLVAPPDLYTLQTQVGHRIAATGQLSDRELRVTSVQTTGARCD
jgi:hypothetical protein